MPSLQTRYLQQMGLDVWSLAHPERLMGYQAPAITLADDCRLILVCEHALTTQEVGLFERVLKSMQLTLAQAQQITPAQWTNLAPHQCVWVWFAGCEAIEVATLRSLHSPLLADIEGNTQHRRDLWQQIQSYESK